MACTVTTLSKVHLSLPVQHSGIDNKKFVKYKYVDESKIIRTIGTCFAIGYTAGWA
jgi:hypothetical protein